jgi:hypothetical protein
VPVLVPRTIVSASASGGASRPVPPIISVTAVMAEASTLFLAFLPREVVISETAVQVWVASQ